MTLTVLRAGIARIALGALLMAAGIACGATDEPGIPPIANPGTIGTPGEPIRLDTAECIGWAQHQEPSGEWVRDDCIAWMTR